MLLTEQAGGKRKVLKASHGNIRFVIFISDLFSTEFRADCLIPYK